MKITTRFDWHCDLCGVVIDDGDGYLHTDHLAAIDSLNEHRRHNAELEGREVVTIDEISIPTIIGWEVHHRDCDPRPLDADYWIDLERARTLEQMLGWNAHLHLKDWIGYTDWDRFLVKRLAD